jgi:hypothetical protein
MDTIFQQQEQYETEEKLFLIFFFHFSYSRWCCCFKISGFVWLGVCFCLPIPTHHFPPNSCITPTKQLCFFIHFHLHNEILTTNNSNNQPKKKTRKKFLFEQKSFSEKEK